MIDYHTELIKTLKAILPTYYAQTFTSSTATPCITYLETENIIEHKGDTRSYSRVTYEITIWGHSIAEVQNYAQQVDKALHPLGWTRTSSDETFDAEAVIAQKTITYEGLALEIY